MGTHPIFESDFDCLTDPAEIDEKKNGIGPNLTSKTHKTQQHHQHSISRGQSTQKEICVTREKLRRSTKNEETERNRTDPTKKTNDTHNHGSDQVRRRV